jgi:hypothetical protein
MAIELSDITFTDQDDRVPLSGQEQIFNTGIANTFAGRDVIEGRVNIDNISTAIPINIDDPDLGSDLILGIYNDTGGIIDTGDDNDVITGISTGREGVIPNYGYGIINRGIISTGNGNDELSSISLGLNALDGTINRESEGIIDTGNGNDEIRGSGQRLGIVIEPNSILDSGKGDDYIRGTGVTTGGGILNNSYTFNTGDGDDTISGFNLTSYGFGISNNGVMDTGNGNDIIDAGTGNDGGFAALQNFGVINTGNGNDSLLSRRGSFSNRGVVFLGDDEDSIIANADFPGNALVENFGFIGTGNANDTITSTGVIYNEGVIETGNGDDSIIVDGGIDDLTGTSYSIYNNGGAINMGDGNDSIIANQGFESAENSSGAWFLGEGDDYIKGFGSGDFYGGNGNDTLELTPGTYTVGIWGEGGESPIFTKGNQLMITSEFEKLIAGGTIYDFTSLTAGQIIVVA